MLFVATIRGNKPVRLLSYILATGLAIWCCVISHRIGRASGRVDVASDLSRPMYWYIGDLEQRTRQTPTIHAKVEGLSAAWTAYWGGSTNFAQAIISITAIDDNTNNEQGTGAVR